MIFLDFEEFIILLTSISDIEIRFMGGRLFGYESLDNVWENCL
jgi:hypothetical protein